MLKMINVFLVDGDVYGRKIFKVANHSITLSEFPKNNITHYEGENVLEMNCVYFLLNLKKKKIYIGSTNNFAQSRKKQHLAEKSFWDTLYVFTSPDFEMYPSLIEDIEEFAITAIKNQNKWVPDNKQGGTRRNKKAIWNDLLEQYFETIKILANIAGCNALPSKRISPEPKEDTKIRKPKNDVSPNQTKIPKFCIVNQIANGVKGLLEIFAKTYLANNTEMSVNDFVNEFNKKANSTNPFYALDYMITENKTEKLYKQIVVNGQQLNVLKSHRGAGPILCPIMTQMGIRTVQVDVNAISFPPGIYVHKTARAEIIAEVQPNLNSIKVKKGSYHVEQKNNKPEKIVLESDMEFPTFNKAKEAFTPSGGNKGYWIYEDGRTLVQIEEQLLVEQAKNI